MHFGSMDLKVFRRNIGTIIRFRPRPKTDASHYVSEDYNSWVIIHADDEGSRYLFQNTRTNHELTLSKDSIREFREPDLVILRGQVLLQNQATIIFEPFAPGLEQNQDTKALAEPLASEEVKEILSEALALGHEIVVHNGIHVTEAWIRFTREFIGASLGRAESILFISNDGYTFFSGSNDSKRIMDGRLRRLSELLSRVAILRIDTKLNPQEWKNQLLMLRHQLEQFKSIKS